MPLKSSMKITVVDYGLGNIGSVRSAFEFMGAEVTISANPSIILDSDALILPGVGNFGRGMQNLHELDLVETLNEAVIGKHTPILGICLGMQLFARASEESPGICGLGWIPGEVKKMATNGLRLPHMGFNEASISSAVPHLFSSKDDKLPDFYFVHSYCFSPDNDEHILARTTYGSEFASAIRKDNIVGVQFHPEKSQSCGLHLIANFLQIVIGGELG